MSESWRADDIQRESQKEGTSEDSAAIKDILDDMARSKTRKVISSSSKSGRRADVITSGRRGRYVRARIPTDVAKDIALGPTIRAAVIRTGSEKGMKFLINRQKGRTIEIKRQDLREKVRRKKISTHICLVFDASSSMVREEKLAAANSVIDAILLDAYQKRDRISLVIYQGQGAKVVLPFTSSIELAKPYLTSIKFGGTTPLSSGILVGLQNIESKTRIEQDAIPIMIVITDGTANTPINPGEDLRRELVEICSIAQESRVSVLVIDVSKEGAELAAEVAKLCKGRYYYSGSLGKTTEYIDQVDQEIITKAFILNTINPSLEGILVMGANEKTKRAVIDSLREILPEIETVTGCRFGCCPTAPEKYCWECKGKAKRGHIIRDLKPTPIVELKTGVTPEELVGFIDPDAVWDIGQLKTEPAALSKAVNPGILAQANNGLIFIESVDRLNDEIIEILSEVAITGTNSIKYEDVTVVHNASFSLAGHLEDIEKIHPLLKDSFGMLVDLGMLDEVERRIRQLKQRKEFDTDSKKFREKLKKKRKQFRTEIIRAQAILPDVVTPEEHLDLIARISIDAQIVGHTTDILIERVARTIAAGNGRSKTIEDDIVKAAEMIVPLKVSEERFRDMDISIPLTEMVKQYE